MFLRLRKIPEINRKLKIFFVKKLKLNKKIHVKNAKYYTPQTQKIRLN